MPVRAAAFFDGQNLFRSAKAAFHVTHPNYDPKKLASLVCSFKDLELAATKFYSGIPTAKKDPRWHSFWTRKALSMKRAGIEVFQRDLRYRIEEVRLPNGDMIPREVAVEKGIDVRIALDIIKVALTDKTVGAMVIFSQDQDLSEAVDEVKLIAKSQGRRITLVSAFPANDGTGYGRGINGTDWFKIDQRDYESCVDPFDYRDKLIKHRL